MPASGSPRCPSLRRAGHSASSSPLFDAAVVSPHSPAVPAFLGRKNGGPASPPWRVRANPADRFACRETAAPAQRTSRDRRNRDFRSMVFRMNVRQDSRPSPAAIRSDSPPAPQVHIMRERMAIFNDMHGYSIMLVRCEFKRVFPCLLPSCKLTPAHRDGARVARGQSDAKKEVQAGS